MNKKILFIAAAVLCLYSCSEIPIDTNTEDIQEIEDSSHSSFIPGIANVKFSEDFVNKIEKTKSSLDEKLVAELGITSMERLFPDAGKFEKRSREEGLHRWYRIKYNSEISQTKAETSLTTLPEIEYFEPIIKHKKTAIFNDPDLSLQWHYYSDGSLYNTKAGADIDVIPVWEQYTTGNSSVIVAVVDGGIDYNHEDLKGQVIESESKNFVRNTSYIVPHGHGTHVAGTIAAINNNGKGGCGIAGGDGTDNGVKLISCQVFEPDESFPDDPSKDRAASNFETAIKWAADHGAVLCNNSWGNQYNNESDARDAVTSQSMKEAIDYFNKYAGMDENGEQVGPMAGGVCFFAAGNDSWAYAHPADYEEVIAVGSFDALGNRASYSNYGSWVDIGAPGGSQYNKQIYSTIPDNKYTSYQGTSMACPHATGVAALIVSYFGGPGFTREMLINRLIEGADNSFLSGKQIGPKIDAYGSFVYGNNFKPEPVTEINTSSHSNFIDVTWKVNASKTGEKAFAYLVVAGKNKEVIENIDIKNIPSDVLYKSIKVDNKNIGEDIVCSFSNLDFSTSYYITVYGYDYNSNYSEKGIVVTQTTQNNNPPVITPVLPASSVLKAHETIQIPFTVYEEDGHDYTIALISDLPFIKLKNNTESNILEINALQADPGNYTAIVKVEDSYGAFSEWKYSFTVLENHAPVLKTEDMPNYILYNPGDKFTLNLNDYFEDPDGEKLIFKMETTDASVLHTSTSGTVLTGTAMGYGKMTVSVSASDAKGSTINVSFNVLIRDKNTVVQCYPNPLKNDLYIATGVNEASVTVNILSETGVTIYSSTASEISAFNPLHIDTTNLAPGIYHVKVVYESYSYEGNLIKY